MQQINEDTGTARPVQRKANPLATPGSAGAGREGPLSRTSIYTLLRAWIDVVVSRRRTVWKNPDVTPKFMLV